MGSKTTESLIDSAIFLFSKVLGMVVQIKDVEGYQKGLKNDYIIHQELSTLAGSAALKCGRLIALANATLITAKHVDFDKGAKSEEISGQCLLNLRLHIRQARSHSKRQPPLQTQSLRKDQSELPLAKWSLKEHVWLAKRRKKPQLRPRS